MAIMNNSVSYLIMICRYWPVYENNKEMQDILSIRNIINLENVFGFT